MKGVRGVTFDADKDAYLIAHDHGTEVATCLVNTTGSLDRDVMSPRQPALVHDLVARGLLRPYTRDGHALKGAEVDLETFRLPGSTRIYLASMLLWGPGFFTSSAFVMAHIVERLLAGMYGARP